jgi:nuclear transport factor 2 (NTF2) superfamily protein
MDENRLEEIGNAYTAAWNSLDPAGVASFHNEASSLKVNDAEPAVGREAIAEVAQRFMAAFPDMVLVMDSIRPTEAGAEYHWTYSGTNTGPGGTGKAVRFSGYEEWTLDEGGLISEALGHFDEEEYNRQLAFGVGGS